MGMDECALAGIEAALSGDEDHGALAKDKGTIEAMRRLNLKVNGMEWGNHQGVSLINNQNPDIRGSKKALSSSAKLGQTYFRVSLNYETSLLQGPGWQLSFHAEPKPLPRRTQVPDIRRWLACGRKLNSQVK